MAVGGEHLARRPRLVRGRAALRARPWCAPGRARRPTAGGRRGRSASQSMTRGSKLNAAWSSASSDRPAGRAGGRLEHGLGLGVGAVELDVAEGPLGLGPALLEPGRPLGLRAPERAARRAPSRPRSSTFMARCSWRLHPAPAGERPLGHDDGLALGVVERVLGEPAPAPGRRGAGSAAGSGCRTPTWRRPVGSGSGPRAATVDDGGHHEVDGDDVDHALGDAGELLQQAAGVGDDHRLGHAEAADPARAGARPAPTR